VFQRRLAKVNKAPWLMATGEDYRYRETEGGSPSLMTRFMHWYMDRVLQLATQEIAVRSVLLDAFSMLVPPSALFRPSVLLRVIRHALSTRAGQADKKNRSGRGQAERAPRSRNSGGVAPFLTCFCLALTPCLLNCSLQRGRKSNENPH
jgi:hypothetical protein